MEPQKNGHTPDAADEADFAKAFQELQRGEQTAAALEDHLTALEAKIEELLAQADQEQAVVQRAREQTQTLPPTSGNPSTNTPAQEQQ